MPVSGCTIEHVVDGRSKAIADPVEDTVDGGAAADRTEIGNIQPVEIGQIQSVEAIVDEVVDRRAAADGAHGLADIGDQIAQLVAANGADRIRDAIDGSGHRPAVAEQAAAGVAGVITAGAVAGGASAAATAVAAAAVAGAAIGTTAAAATVAAGATAAASVGRGSGADTVATICASSAAGVRRRRSVGRLITRLLLCCGRSRRRACGLGFSPSRWIQE
jgi:hypothetical protein